MRGRALKWSFVIVAALGVLSVAIAWILPTMWLRADEVEIRHKLWDATPIGTKFTDVEEFIRSQRWHYFHSKRDSGEFELYLREKHHPDAATAIQARLGEYQGFPWSVRVRGLWVFDSDDKLIDITVAKIHDSP
jgi:hypothetical protein